MSRQSCRLRAAARNCKLTEMLSVYGSVTVPYSVSRPSDLDGKYTDLEFKPKSARSAAVPDFDVILICFRSKPCGEVQPTVCRTLFRYSTGLLYVYRTPSIPPRILPFLYGRHRIRTGGSPMLTRQQTTTSIRSVCVSE